MEHLTAVPLAMRPRPPLPHEARMEMRPQDLGRPDRPAGPRPKRDHRANALRLALFAATLALTAWFGQEMYRVLAVGELVAIEAVLLGLFVVNIGWICFGSLSTVLGLIGPPRAGATDAALEVRTAILLPTYNEDPTGVIAAAVAILRGLEARDGGETFDLFILSDTTQPDIWLAEQAQVDFARTQYGLEDRLYYRHRSINRDRKVGNITDWVERWGGAYPFMLSLDADSLMEPDTILDLARRLQAAPETGLIQTVPRLIGARTPLARVQQFAGRVYGPILARGVAAWFGDAGNFWGHNAIIRTEAFARSAGLPQLPGRKPFGGLILSHDFVEAALLRRNGWGVRLADDLGGSFERAPPNLVEMAARDRRWAQGNLQHLGVLARTAGLHPISRLHMAMGAMAYLAAPVWLIFLLVGMALALYADLVPPNYFPDGWALFPTWPQIDFRRAITLFGLCLLALFLPKLLGLAAFLREPASRGQRLRAIPDFLVELVLSALTAPILMLTQTRAVIEILVGRDSGWSAQARDAGRLSWGTLWLFHRRHMLVGALLAVAAGAISWSLLAWMSPALVSMLIAAPLGAFLGANAAGDWMTRRRMLLTPEDRHPPEILRAADAVVEALRASPPAPGGLGALLGDPQALARHLAWLDGATERRPGEPSPVLAEAWLRITDGCPPEQLNAKQAFGVLASTTILQRIVDGGQLARLRAERRSRPA